MESSPRLLFAENQLFLERRLAEPVNRDEIRMNIFYRFPGSLNFPGLQFLAHLFWTPLILFGGLWMVLDQSQVLLQTLNNNFSMGLMISNIFSIGVGLISTYIGILFAESTYFSWKFFLPSDRLERIYDYVISSGKILSGQVIKIGRSRGEVLITYEYIRNRSHKVECVYRTSVKTDIKVGNTVVVLGADIFDVLL